MSADEKCKTFSLKGEDKYLLAQAVQFTRVSYFSKEERKRLTELVREVTGYVIEGGL